MPQTASWPKLLSATPAGLAVAASGGRWWPAPHLRYLNSKLLDVAAGRINRLAVQMPPRHGKSELISRYFPAWYLNAYPWRRVLLASYAATFAAGWGRKARNVVTDNQHLLGIRPAADSSAADRWEVAGTDGGMVTAGVGGPITGRGADLLIVDDPVKNAEEALSPVYREKAWDWWRSTAYTRLEPTGSVVVVMTRWHPDDLLGRILSQESEPWESVILPALATSEDDPLGRAVGEPLCPEWYDVPKLERIRETVEAHWWQALYQQNPRPDGLLEWPESYFPESMWFDEWPAAGLSTKVTALDPSKGRADKPGDYSAFVLLALDRDGHLWVEADLLRAPTPQLVEDGIAHYLAFNPSAVCTEANQFQEMLASEFLTVGKQRRLAMPLYTITNFAPKVMRIRTLGPYLARGELHFRRTKGTELLVNQMRDFPEGEHDDGPDALEMAIRMLWHMMGRKSTLGDPKILRV